MSHLIPTSRLTLGVASVMLSLAVCLQGGTFTADFDNGQVPEGALVFGAAVIEAPGAGEDASLVLTRSVPSQSGSFLIEDLDGGAPMHGFRASFLAQIGGGGDSPADGLSFNFADDLPDSTAPGQAEEGVGSGLSVCFDIYDNTDGNPNNGVREAPAITLKWNGVVVGKVLLYRAPVPGFGTIANGRFGFYGRTGGSRANQWVDDVKIAINTQPAAGPTIAATLSAGNLVHTWSGGGTLQSTTALPGAWSTVAGASSGYTVPASEPARYYRVVQ